MSEPASPFSSPPRVPGYELVRSIGRGSYGEVWLARDAAGIFRAVKLVHRNTFEHDRPYERELSGIQKFEPVSRSHPSQVSILQVGRDPDAAYFYYVMELADDASTGLPVDSGTRAAAVSQFRPTPLNPATYAPKTLRSVLTQRGRISFRECLEISLALTTALEHLHLNGLIHRDVKPSNVIFVDGVPKLADIGLVTDADSTVSYVGTEGFLPPEGPGTPQADLYSLGKVLYEISTGRDRMDFPELPTFIDTPGEKENLLELNQIFLKACQNDPRQRYQSSGEMFADLQLLHRGRSLRQARTIERRLVRLRRAAILMVALVVAGAVANHLLQLQRLRRAEQEEARQQREAQLARGVAADKSRRLAELYAANSEALAAQGDLAGALVWRSKALVDNTDPALANSHRKAIQAWIQQSPKAMLLLAHPGAIHTASLSAGGQRLITAGQDGTARLWNARTGDAIGLPLKHSTGVVHSALSPDGARALTFTQDGLVHLWNALDDHPVATRLPLDSPARLAQLSPTGRQLVLVAGTNAVELWEAGSSRRRFNFHHQDAVTVVEFSPDGQQLVTGSSFGRLRTWNTDTGESVADTSSSTNEIAKVCFTPNGRRFAAAAGAEVRLFDTRSGDPAPFVLHHDGTVRSLVFSPDGQRLASGGDDASVRIWDARTGRSLGAPLRLDGPVREIHFTPDGRMLFAAAGRQVRFWNASTFETFPSILVHNTPVTAIRTSPEGDGLLTACADGTAALWSWVLPGSNAIEAAIPERDWTAFAQILSGRHIATNEQIAPISTEEREAQFQNLRSKTPSALARPEPLAWHRGEAEACVRSRKWFAAAFHWQHGLALSPNDLLLKSQLARATDELAREAIADARPTELPNRIPARSAAASSQLIDLSDHYNAALTETWLPSASGTAANDLAAMPGGVQTFGGVAFDVRGVVQLTGRALENLGGRFPREVNGIRIGQRARKLHFLHGTAWSDLFGTPVGRYVVHFANGASREIRLLAGQNVREWWSSATQPQPANAAGVAWEGSNPASRALGMKLRLYQVAWINPQPEMPIARIDFQSTQENSAPFLIAITVE